MKIVKRKARMRDVVDSLGLPVNVDFIGSKKREAENVSSGLSHRTLAEGTTGIRAW